MRNRDATLVVAFAAALWGLDGWLRGPLARHLDAATVVLWEHVIAVVVLLPVVPSALRAFARADWRSRFALVLIGVGASAVATALFTEAFAISTAHHDYVTPLVLQKLQPVIALGLAAVLLRERLRPVYLLYVVPALAGAWLLTFAHPFDVQVSEARSAGYAVGAAALWGAGTVLGRFVSVDIAARDVTTLRFVFGLAGAIVVTDVTGARWLPAAHQFPRLALLALVPGLIALVVYYWALRRTPASRATLAELAFPLTAAIVGVTYLHTPLSGSQWTGLAIVAAAVLALGWHEATRPPAVEAPQDELVAG